MDFTLTKQGKKIPKVLFVNGSVFRLSRMQQCNKINPESREIDILF